MRTYLGEEVREGKNPVWWRTWGQDVHRGSRLPRESHLLGYLGGILCG